MYQINFEEKSLFDVQLDLKQMEEMMGSLGFIDQNSNADKIELINMWEVINQNKDMQIGIDVIMNALFSIMNIQRKAQDSQI